MIMFPPDCSGGNPIASGTFLFARAELRQGLGRLEAFAKTERRCKLNVLGRSDELLQLLVERLVKLRVVWAEAEAAMANHGIARDFAERLRRLNALICLSHLADRKRGACCRMGAARANGADQARLVGQDHELRLV